MTTPPDHPAPTPKGIDAADLDPTRRPPPRRRWPWIVGALVLVPIALVLAFNWHAARQLRQALDDLAARGEPTTYAEAYAFISADPPADDDNLAKVPLLLAMSPSAEGLAMMEELEQSQAEELQLIDKSDLPWVRSGSDAADSAKRTTEDFASWHPDRSPGSAAMAPDHWAWVEHADGPAASLYHMTEFLHPTIHQMAAATRHRTRALWSDAEIDDHRLFIGLAQLTHAPELNHAFAVVRTLQAVALVALERDDPELAAAAIELQMAMVRSLGQGQLMIGGLVAASMLRVIDAPLYDGLRRQAWSEPQLTRLQTSVELTLPMMNPEPLMRMERVFGIRFMQLLKRERAGLYTDDGLGEAAFVESVLLTILPAGVMDRAAVSMIQAYDSDFLQPGALLPEEVPPAGSDQPGWLAWLEHFDVAGAPTPDASMLFAFARRLRSAETRLRLAHTAIAMERFQLEHGRYPDDWQALVPGFLTDPPTDPFTGGELVLLPADPAAGRQRPVIYSLGLNREDNGGQQAQPDDTHPTGDVVWGYPGDSPGPPP